MIRVEPAIVTLLKVFALSLFFQVKFRRVGSQIRGEVFYHTPEGRKLRTYPEVLKVQ